MNYIQHRSRNSGDSNTWSGTVSNVALNRTPAKPTNVQDNSLLVEKDTARRYWFDAESSNTVTFQSDFSSDNFNDTGTKIGVANNTLEWDGAQNGSVHGSTIDLTSIDTKAVFRAKLRINTLTAPSSASSFILIGFSDSDHTTAGDSSQDGIGLIIQNDADVANTFRAMHVDGAPFSPNAGTAFATVPATATDYFIEVVLDVNTWYVRIYSDSDYSTLTEEETGSLTATGLRYFGIKMRSSASVGGTFDGYIDDFKFYNGVTSTTTPATWTKQNPELPTVSGLYVHYDATDVNSITKDSNNRISQWNDKSGGERHLTQATSGNQPLWISSDEAGNPVIDFSDDRYMSDTWTAQSLPNTIFIVARLPVATASRTNIISGSGGNAQSVFGDGSNTWKYAAGSAQGGTKTGIEDTWQYIYALYGDDYTFEIGGELISGANCGTDTWTGMEVGASSGAQFGNMKIGEIIGYNVAVKGDDKTAIINYLKEKWERT
jgi:hypothetical protein